MPLANIYRASDIDDYFRKQTTIFTRRAEPAESKLLRQHPDHPVMIVTKINVDARGRALGYSEAVWAGDRIQLSFDGLDDPFLGEEGNIPRTASFSILIGKMENMPDGWKFSRARM